MKLNKQAILLIFISIIGITTIVLIPNFEREEFSPSIVEEISAGNITTTTNENNSNNDENTSTNTIPDNEETEVFETNIYDQLLVNNETTRIDNLFIIFSN